MNTSTRTEGGIGGRGRRGFTLVELLVVIAIIALLATILAPSLLRVRTKVFRAMCASNLHQIADACISYAMDGKMHRLTIKNQLPTVAPRTNNWYVYGYDQANDRPLGNVGCMWLLVKYRYASSGRIWLCPEAAHLDLDMRELTSDDDHFEVNTCSYSYISMVRNNSWGDNNPADETTLKVNPQLIIVGDKNPRTGLSSSVDPNHDRNSKNHQEEGQNVARLDRVAKWIETPAGDGDDVYSSSGGGDTGGAVSLYERLGRRGSVSDTYLIP